MVAGGDNNYYGNQEPISEGATVRERQAIITIPDMTHMSVNVKIHESYIQKIKKGQKARITVDAFPDTVLTGEVTKVGVLPDSQNRWMNPDLKVYNTTIAINGTYDWVKPGMSAKVEILVNKLDRRDLHPDPGRVAERWQGILLRRRRIQTGSARSDSRGFQRRIHRNQTGFERRRTRVAPPAGKRGHGGPMGNPVTKPTRLESEDGRFGTANPAQAAAPTGKT